MKKFIHSRTGKLAVFVGVLLAASPAYALFGITDIIYWIQQIALMKREVSQTQAQMDMVKNNIKSFGRKSTWKTMADTAWHTNVADRFGETSGWSAALNNNPSMAVNAWRSATLQLSSPTYLAGRATLGSNGHLTALASVEAMDGSGPNCMSTIAQYRSQRAANQSAVSALETTQLDGSSATNAEVQQLNLLNAAEAQRMNEVQGQGSLQACLAEQQVIANTYQRNNEVEALNQYNHAVEVEMTRPQMQSSEMVDTAYSYLPK